jgi:thioredoxin-related protein
MGLKGKNLKMFTLLIATFLILIGLLLILPQDSDADSSEIKWYNYEEGMVAARSENKSILLYFHTDWCSWCDKMDKDTFQDKDVISEARNFINIKIDGDDRRDLVDKYKVSGYPTVVFLNSSGSTTNKVVGYQNPSQFLTAMDGEKSIEDSFICPITSSWVNIFILILLPISLIIILMVLEKRKNQLSKQTGKGNDNKKIN